MSMSYSLKAKCQGCLALQKDKAIGFVCSMGLPITFDGVGVNAMHPAPAGVKCYKPKSGKDLKDAARLQSAKTAIVA